MKSLLQKNLLRMRSWIGELSWDWEMGSWDCRNKEFEKMRSWDCRDEEFEEMMSWRKVLVELRLRDVVERLNIKRLMIKNLRISVRIRVSDVACVVSGLLLLWLKDLKKSFRLCCSLSVEAVVNIDLNCFKVQVLSKLPKDCLLLVSFAELTDEESFVVVVVFEILFCDEAVDDLKTFVNCVFYAF